MDIEAKYEEKIKELTEALDKAEKSNISLCVLFSGIYSMCLELCAIEERTEFEIANIKKNLLLDFSNLKVNSSLCSKLKDVLEKAR